MDGGSKYRCQLLLSYHTFRVRITHIVANEDACIARAADSIAGPGTCANGQASSNATQVLNAIVDRSLPGNREVEADIVVPLL